MSARKHTPLLLVFAVLIGWWAFYELTASADLPTHLTADAPYHYDPQMMYFTNTLMPFAGRAYTYALHPGVLMHVTGTALMALTYPFVRLSGADFTAYHINNPATFFVMARAVLMLASVGTTWAVYRAGRVHGAWTAAAVALSFFAVYRFGFLVMTYWSHNMVAYPLGVLVLVLAFRWLREDAPLNRRQRWTLGLLGGLLTAAVAYNAATVVGLVVTVGLAALLRKRGVWVALGSAFEVGVASLVSFFGLAVPTSARFEDFLYYMTQISSNTGAYGTGEAGFVSTDSLAYGLRFLVTDAGLISAVLVVSIGALWVAIPRMRRTHTGLAALSVGMTAHMIVLLVLLVKQPHLIYYGALAALVPVALLIVLTVWPSGVWIRGLTVAVFVLVAAQLVTRGGHHLGSVAEARAERAVIDTFIADYAERTAQSPDAIRQLISFDVPDACYGLWFGLGFAEFQFAEQVEACRYVYEYNTQSDWGKGVDGPRWLGDEAFCWDVIVTREKFIGPIQESVGTVIGVDSLAFVTNDARYAPREGVRYEFGDDFCGEGWHAPEQNGDMDWRWMAEPVATLEQTLVPNDYTLTLHAPFAITPEVMRSLTLTVNGEALELETVPDQPATYAAQIPREVVERSAHATDVRFTVSEVMRPEAGDLRRLGVAFDWVEIVPSDDAAQ